MAYDDTDSNVGKTDPVVQRMLDNYKMAAEAEAENRKRGLAALKFRKGGDEQWDQNILKLRQGDNRPSETYNQIPQFIHQVTNDMRINMPQTRFMPGSDGDEDVSEIYEDLARNIQSQSEGEVAYDTAADSQVTIGWGYWRYITAYENELTFDQIIKLQWVPNTFTIYDDPYTILQDRSDRKFLIQVCDMPTDEFNNEYGKKYGSTEVSLMSIGDGSADWCTDTTTRVAEYWELTTDKSTLYRDANGNISSVKPKGKYDERVVDVAKVMWYKCTAKEKLEEKQWIGTIIPYVFAAGETLYIDGKVYYSGLTEAMMPSQRQYNYWSNAATEMVALAPKAPFIMEVGQVKGLEKFWDNANIKNYPYLPYNATNLNGTQAPPPQRTQNGSDIGAMVALVQQAQQNFYTTTGIYPASLGQQSNEKSGKAIIARQKEGDVSTFHYQDNIARALRAGGRILKELIPKVYDGSREVNLLREDKTSYKAKINQPQMDDNGQPVLDKKTNQPKMLDLTTGTYNVMVTTGPSYTTKRQESQELMTSLVQSAPQLMQFAPDIIISSFDTAGAEKLAERMKKTLPPGLADDDAENPIPPQVTAQIQQMQQIIQQLTQELQQSQGELQNKQTDYQLKQADLQLKMQDMQSSGQADANKTETDRMKMQLDAQKIQIDQQKLQLEAQKIELDREKMLLDAQLREKELSMPHEKPQSVESGTPIEKMGRSAIQGHLTDMDSQAENEALEREADSQRSEMLLQGVVGIQKSLADLTASINAPKRVIRDQNGMIAGVQ